MHGNYLATGSGFGVMGFPTAHSIAYRLKDTSFNIDPEHEEEL